MKAREFLIEDTRIPTGVGKGTISDLSDEKDFRKLSPEQFDAGKLQKQYLKLKEILARNGEKFSYVNIGRIGRSPLSFVAVSPKLIWQKVTKKTSWDTVSSNNIYVGGTSFFHIIFL